MVEENKLSPEELAVLKERAEARKKESEWVRLEPGEKRLFTFNTLKAKVVPDRFDAEGVKTRTQYKIIEPNLDLMERKYEVTANQADKIDKILGQGKSNIWCEKDLQGRFTTFKAAES
jgi:hypothetical protein